MSAQTEVGRLAASVEQEVQRIRELLIGTLAVLDAGVATNGLVTALELRVQRAKEPTVD